MSACFPPATALLVACLSFSSASSQAPSASKSPAVATSTRVDAEAVVRERLGIELSVTSSLVRRRITSTRTPYGFLIAKVAPDSAGARAGLMAGDVVLEWDGMPIRTVQELADAATRLSAATAARTGASVRYSRKREGVPLTFPATDPWETRCTRIRLAGAASRRGRPI